MNKLVKLDNKIGRNRLFMSFKELYILGFSREEIQFFLLNYFNYLKTNKNKLIKYLFFKKYTNDKDIQNAI